MGRISVEIGAGNGKAKGEKSHRKKVIDTGHLHTQIYKTIYILSLSIYLSPYIYIYVCVCVCL